MISRKQVDGIYYITHVLIPPLERVFNLVGVDVRGWYDEMPKPLRIEQEDTINLSPRKQKEATDDEKSKIVDHFHSCRCLVCRSIITNEGEASGCLGFDATYNFSGSRELCTSCLRDPYKAILSLLNRVKKLERRLVDTHRVCSSCTGAAMSEQIECMSTDCPWLFSRKKAEDKGDQVARLQELVRELELCIGLGESLASPPPQEPEECHNRESSMETTPCPDDDLRL